MQNNSLLKSDCYHTLVSAKCMIRAAKDVPIL